MRWWHTSCDRILFVSLYGIFTIDAPYLRDIALKNENDLQAANFGEANASRSDFDSGLS